MDFPDDYIEEYDFSNILKTFKNLPNQLLEGYDSTSMLSIQQKPEKVVIAGMGGSFIAGMFVEAYLSESNTPFVLHNDYGIPNSVTERDLVICVSYSGNTEETLSACKAAKHRKCNLVTLSSGGKLLEMSTIGETQHIKLPKGLQPRATLGYQLGALLGVMQEAGLIRGAGKELKKTSNSLSKLSLESPALKLAEKLEGKIPLIYSPSEYYHVAYRWKTQFNENARIPAFANKLPEMNHNEIMSFRNASDRAFHVILLGNPSKKRMEKRIEYTKELATEVGLDVTHLGIKGDNLLTKYLSAAMLGDLTSYFIGLKKKHNPGKVPEIEEFKKKMGPYV